MPLLDNYQVSKDRIFEWTRWIYTFLRNAIHKAAFALDLVDEQWLLDRLVRSCSGFLSSHCSNGICSVLK